MGNREGPYMHIRHVRLETQGSLRIHESGREAAARVGRRAFKTSHRGRVGPAMGPSSPHEFDGIAP